MKTWQEIIAALKAGTITPAGAWAAAQTLFNAEGWQPDAALGAWNTILQQSGLPAYTPPQNLGAGDLRDTAGTGTEVQNAARTRQEEKDQEGVFLRYMQSRPEYQNATGYVQKAMEEPYSRLQPQYELMGSTTAASLQPTFEKFLGGGRFSVDQLKAKLGQLTNYIGMAPGTTGLGYKTDPTTGKVPEGVTPGTEDTMRAMYGSGTDQGRGRQFEASIQPLLEQMAPYFRKFFQQGAQDRFTDYVSANPEKDWLPYSKKQGYW